MVAVRSRHAAAATATAAKRRARMVSPALPAPVADMSVDEAEAFAADGVERFDEVRGFVQLAGQLQAWEALQRLAPRRYQELSARLPREVRRAISASIAGMRGEPSEPNWPGPGEIGGMLREPAPQVEWLATNRLPKGRAAAITANGGGSKTTFQATVAVGAVVGRTTFGWPIAQTGAAVLLLAENTAAETHRALAKVASALEIADHERAQVEQRLRVFSLAGQRSTLLELRPGGELRETWRVDALREELAKLSDLVFVGLDPAIALSEGAEKEPAHQRRLGELVDRLAIETGAAVLLATHAPKSLASVDDVAGHVSRGSGALTDALRAEWVLRGMTAAEAKRFRVDPESADRRRWVRLAATKGNELPPEAFEPTWLMRGPGGVLLAADLAHARGAEPLARREEQALVILEDLAKTGVPKLAEWRAACVEAGVITGHTEAAQAKAMNRVRDALLAAALIRPGVARGYFVPTQGRL